MRGARVLELGCGHGLPGVVAALRGAHSVTWQDYNADVLHSLTAPTAVANLRRGGDQAQGCSMRFMSGDWGALHALLPGQQFDLILTADTLYSPAAQVRNVRMVWLPIHPPGTLTFPTFPSRAATAAGAHHAQPVPRRRRARGRQVLLLWCGWKHC